MMHEGQQVTYVGIETPDGLLPGDTGKLLMHASAQAAHVMVGQSVYLVLTDDLVAAHAKTAAVDLLEDSLEVGSLSVTALHEAYDEEGVEGILSTMASLGHLAGFEEIAEEALGVVTARIRQDPSFREVMASLDEEDAERLVRMASAALIRDAFDEDEGG